MICTHPNTSPGYVVYINGAHHVHQKCLRCKWINPKAEPKTPYVGTQLPTCEDNSDPDAYPECSYNGCNKPGYEEHHWALRALFQDDADNWPTSQLCQPHHAQWHSTLVKHGLKYPVKETV